MLTKSLRLFVCTITLLGTTHLTVVQAQTAGGGEGGGNLQTPVQVIVQIVLTAVVLRILAYFDLP